MSRDRTSKRKLLRERKKKAKEMSAFRASQAVREREREQRGEINRIADNERKRLVEEVRGLVNQGISLEEAINEICKQNANSIALSSERVYDPKKSLKNWYLRRYPEMDRDDDDGR